MARILVTEPIAEGGLDRLRDAGHTVDVQQGLSPEELVEAIRGAHALIIRSATDVTAEVLGRSVLRVGAASTFNVVVTNKGDADAYGVMLFVRYSAGLRPVEWAGAVPMCEPMISGGKNCRKPRCMSTRELASMQSLVHTRCAWRSTPKSMRPPPPEQLSISSAGCVARSLSIRA